jgi:lysophospholipase L1-like esterase
VSGCGSGSGPDRTVVAALGDSITAGNPGYDPNPAVRKHLGLGHDPQSQWEYWAQRKHSVLEFRNCGVRGERTDQIAQRFEECATGADAIVIQGGTNDLAAGIPVEAVSANLRAMVESAKKENLDVALANVIPYNDACPQSGPVIEDLNRRIGQIGRSEDVAVLHFHETLEDPRDPCRMKAEWTADGIHPSVDGYRRLGEIAFKSPVD